MAQDTEDKRIARLVARGVRAEIKRLGFSKGTRRRAEGDDDDEKPEYAEAVSKAMDHLDAADACFKEADDHYDDGDDKHDEGMSFHAKAVEALDTVRESMDDDNAESGEADPDSEKAAARRLRRAKRLAERHQAT